MQNMRVGIADPVGALCNRSMFIVRGRSRGDVRAAIHPHPGPKLLSVSPTLVEFFRACVPESPKSLQSMIATTMSTGFLNDPVQSPPRVCICEYRSDQ